MTGTGSYRFLFGILSEAADTRIPRESAAFPDERRDSRPVSRNTPRTADRYWTLVWFLYIELLGGPGIEPRSSL